VNEQTLAAIAQWHGVPADQVRPVPAGVANRVYLLGDDLVLRIPRATPYVDDLRKEAAAIPLAQCAGVRAPDIVVFDESCTVVEVPYMVQHRLPGHDLAQLDPSPGQRRAIYREVGRQLAMLHRIELPELPDEAAVFEIPVNDGAGDPYDTINDLCSAGIIDVDAARWLDSWHGLLARQLPAEPAKALIHGDIAPQNLMVTSEPAELSGLVDWGDAEWADPATDFAKTPLAEAPDLLAGYLTELGPDAADGSWEARILSHHLIWALARLEDPTPRPGERHWTAPPASRLIGLLRFAASNPPAPWSGLLPR
jgi:hygromycin-B 7''-O-kinase